MRKKPWEMFGVMPAGDTQYRGPAIGDLQAIDFGQQEIRIPQSYNTQQQMPHQVYQPPFKYEGLDPLFGVLETVDYLTAAPLRAGLYEAVKGLKRGEYGPWNFFKGAVNSYKKPMGSPRGKDIAKEMGISDKPLNEPAGRLSFGGVASKTSPAGVAGFVGGNVLDPTNYVGAGMLVGGLKNVGFKRIKDISNLELLPFTQYEKKLNTLPNIIKTKYPNLNVSIESKGNMGGSRSKYLTVSNPDGEEKFYFKISDHFNKGSGDVDIPIQGMSFKTLTDIVDKNILERIPESSLLKKPAKQEKLKFKDELQNISYKNLIEGILKEKIDPKEAEILIKNAKFSFKNNYELIKPQIDLLEQKINSSLTKQ